MSVQRAHHQRDDAARAAASTMADFVLGLPVGVPPGRQPDQQPVHQRRRVCMRMTSGGSSRNLTVNYGIRWEPYLAPKDANGFTTAFSRENFDKGIHSVTYPNAPAGLLFAGDPGFPNNGSNNTNNLQAVRAARSASCGIRKATTSRRFASGIGHYYDSPKLWTYRAPHAQLAVRQHRRRARGRRRATSPNKNGCAIPMADPVGLRRPAATR